LIASGTGWAAMKALLQQIDAERSRAHRVRLLLDARVGEGMYDAAYLEAFRRGRPWLTVLTAGQAGPAGLSADPGLRALDGILAQRPGAAARQHVYLALAPEASTTDSARAVAARLAAAGVPAMHTHHDSTGIVRVTETSASTTRNVLLSA
jgi:NAD(P)H-flavin reductase